MHDTHTGYRMTSEHIQPVLVNSTRPSRYKCRSAAEHLQVHTAFQARFEYSATNVGSPGLPRYARKDTCLSEAKRAHKSLPAGGG